MKNLLAVVAMGLALTACSKQVQPLQEVEDSRYSEYEKLANSTAQLGLYKFVDNEDQVICYVYSSYNGRSGLQCLRYYHEGSRPNSRQVEG